MSPFSKMAEVAKILGGIPVLEVFPGSAAESAGVRLGDIILRVNGVATPTFQSFLAAGEAHIDDLEFDVFRNGKLLRLKPAGDYDN
jgi:S1-C subfamily serine protease